VRRAKCIMNVTVVGVGDEESTTWKSSDLQGVGPMGMPADDPWHTQRPYSTVLSFSNLLLSSQRVYIVVRESVSILKRKKKGDGWRGFKNCNTEQYATRCDSRGKYGRAGSSSIESLR